MQKKENFMSNVQSFEMSKKASPKTKQTKTKRGLYEVIVHNDNVNTFDHVINCLMDICGHNNLQAQQCALITHTRGKCSVFVDGFEMCMEISKLLIGEDIKTSVNKFNNRYEID
jgi:ATP-dependent Clp protease adaptor protein ClpS